MLGILLASLGTLVGEIGNVIGKNEVAHKRETFLGMGFLNFLWGILIYALLLLFVPSGTAFGDAIGEYHFSFAPVPLALFSLRLLLEIAIITLTLKAVVIATRATFSFLRMLTIPLLLLVDLLLGYSISGLEIAGIGIVVLTTLLLISTKTIKREGMWHVIIASVLAVVTISLYKFNITHYNSVLGEQLTMTVLLATYLGIATVVTTKRNPLRHFKRPQVLLQSFSVSISSVLLSVAFLYAPASLVTTAKRASAILWSLASGNLFFHEQKLMQKLVALGAMCTGLYLLMI